MPVLSSRAKLLAIVLMNRSFLSLDAFPHCRFGILPRYVWEQKALITGRSSRPRQDVRRSLWVACQQRYRSPLSTRHITSIDQRQSSRLCSHRQLHHFQSKSKSHTEAIRRSMEMIPIEPDGTGLRRRCPSLKVLRYPSVRFNSQVEDERAKLDLLVALSRWKESLTAMKRCQLTIIASLLTLNTSRYPCQRPKGPIPTKDYKGARG
jgi:hypothetical protein